MSGQPFPKNSTRARVVFAILLFLGLTFLFTGLPSSSRATPEPGQTDGKRKAIRPEFVPGEVLVRYRSESVAKRQQSQAVLNADGRQLAIQIERFQGADIVPGLRMARVTPADTLAAIEALKKQPDVLYAEPNYLLYPDVAPDDTSYSNLWGLRNTGQTVNGVTGISGADIHAEQAWNTTTGSNAIVVGVIDEGIDVNHPDLLANIWTNPAEIPGNGIDDDANGFIDDVHGFNFITDSGTIPADFHATHVAGIVGARGNNASGVTGVNWQVGLMSLKFLQGVGDTADAIRACNYAKQMQELWLSSSGAKGANLRVLNNSYGGSAFSQSFLDSINGLNQVGILFVAAAGNIDDPSDSGNNDLVPHYPSSYSAPNVIAVASTDSSDNLAGSSHFGLSSVQLGAPGANILSTLPNNNYGFASGTSMASPHVAGAAALLLAANPNLTIQQLKSLLIFNGDLVPSLSGKTLTGRRLNVANSLQAMTVSDSTPPGTVVNFHVNLPQTGRTVNLGWTASGDDFASGQASLYQLTFIDSFTGAVVPLQAFAPPPSGTPQTIDVKIPYGHTKGTITLREFDNVGNEGTPASLNVTVSFSDGNPYATAIGIPAALTTGGTALNLIGDDKLRLNYVLPFTFPFFNESFTQVTISTNGNLFFSPPPTRPGGDADDVPSSSIELARFKMISGLWDDIRTDRRPGDDIYVVTPDASRIIFRWSAVTFGDGTPSTEFPVNFEIELRNDGTIKTRYGVGQAAPINTNLFPVVGISGGEPDAYVIDTHTSEVNLINLTNAYSVSFLPRGVVNPLNNSDFYVDQHYSDFLNRLPDVSGLGFWTNQINECGTDQACIRLRRINVSAAFFLSIEFQETGYLVERLYKASYGDAVGQSTFGGAHTLSVPIVRFNEFLPDQRQIGQGVIIGQPGADQLLESNKQAFIAAFVQRPRFTTIYNALNSAQFVDKLNTNAGNPLSQTERDNLVNGLNSSTLSRAQVLRAVAEDQDLFNAEKNRAFVLAQYFGYLRRDPDSGQDIDHSGYDFWLTKLNQFNGNFVNADMVEAFIVSAEYKGRFGP